jgi:predicted esterase
MLFVLAALATGAVTDLPPGSDPSPLLVLLHGDGETASAMAAAWGAGAKKRGIAMAALQCPKSEGCSAQSWWKWNGDPAWLLDQTRAIAELRPIDTDRMWLVGWSGGGSYIGYRTQELEGSFAALVVHGGGMPPAIATCPDVRAPVYFLVGDGNPLHQLAVRLRQHYDGCGNEVVWTLLPGGSHEDERRALPRYREAILDWLSTKRLARPVAAEAGAQGPAPTPPSPTTPPMQTPTPPAPAPSIAPARASCRCATVGVPPTPCASHGAAAIVLSLLLLARRYPWGRKPSTR